MFNNLPAPFEWIDIPGKGYSISKYPITNAQFAKFIEAGGYNERKWWTEAGWETKQAGDSPDTGSEPWTEPRFWNDPQWNGPEQPVNGISWFESVAFCYWLSETSGEKIMLPTTTQWRYAAQDDDGRLHPWGNEWDASRCNNDVDHKGIGRTTPVRHYEGVGDSPFGVVDMAGNVWEWCLTDRDNNTNDVNSYAYYRVMHGSSWNIVNPKIFYCDYRFWNPPDNRRNNDGFRISRS